MSEAAGPGEGRRLSIVSVQSQQGQNVRAAWLLCGNSALNVTVLYFIDLEASYRIGILCILCILEPNFIIMLLLIF